MTSPLPHISSNYEFCPCCGKDVEELIETTGWCLHCTTHVSIITGTDYVNSKLSLSMAANADSIEYYMKLNNSVWQALALARQDRPVCVVCGERIKRASRTSIFCRVNPECRRYSRRYTYLYRDKNLSKSEALAQILTELTGE